MSDLQTKDSITCMKLIKMHFFSIQTKLPSLPNANVFVLFIKLKDILSSLETGRNLRNKVWHNVYFLRKCLWKKTINILQKGGKKEKIVSKVKVSKVKNKILKKFNDRFNDQKQDFWMHVLYTLLFFLSFLNTHRDIHTANTVGRSRHRCYFVFTEHTPAIWTKAICWQMRFASGGWELCVATALLCVHYYVCVHSVLCWCICTFMHI